jgi:hypothetical protein
MENNEVRAATETVKKSEMLDIRLVPSTSFYVFSDWRGYNFLSMLLLIWFKVNCTTDSEHASVC